MPPPTHFRTRVGFPPPPPFYHLSHRDKPRQIRDRTSHKTDNHKKLHMHPLSSMGQKWSRITRCGRRSARPPPDAPSAEGIGEAEKVGTAVLFRLDRMGQYEGACDALDGLKQERAGRGRVVGGGAGFGSGVGSGWGSDPVAYERIGKAFAEAREKAPLFRHKQLPEAGLYYSARSRDWYGRETPAKYQQAFNGAHKAGIDRRRANVPRDHYGAAAFQNRNGPRSADPGVGRRAGRAGPCQRHTRDHRDQISPRFAGFCLL